MNRIRRKMLELGLNEVLMLGDGDEYDDALIGFAERCGQPTVAVYRADGVIAILAREMSYDEAVEFFEFNIRGAWLGPGTPVFVDDLDDDEDGPAWA